MNELIVAYDKQRGIGADNDLLWQRDLPADLKHFRRLTLGKSVIMGRHTFESLGAKPLPDRQNIVVTSRPTGVEKTLSAVSLEAALALAQYTPVVIGGGQLYAAALPAVERIYATEVQAHFPAATVFFPELAADEWTEVSRQHHTADENNRYDVDFVTYERRRPAP